MKNLNCLATCRKSLVSVLIISIGLLVLSFKPAVNNLTVEPYFIVGPKITIQGKQGTKEWKVGITTGEYNGTFSVTNGGLEDISGFCFKFTVDQVLANTTQANHAVCEAIRSSQCSEISFTQSKLMILPLLKVAHMIGEVKLLSDSHPVSMQLEYSIGADDQIKFIGKQVMFLSEFGLKNENIIAGSEQDEITIVIEFTLAKKQLRMVR